MKCPYCKKEMLFGRIKNETKHPFQFSQYYFYIEENFHWKGNMQFLNPFILKDGIYLNSSKYSEIENCYYCKNCKKVIIDLQ